MIDDFFFGLAGRLEFGDSSFDSSMFLEPGCWVRGLFKEPGNVGIDIPNHDINSSLFGDA